MKDNIDLMKLMQQNFARLSKGQKLIAEYIMENYDKAAFMTAAKLGETVGVSESTVVRFADTLGYNGYRELQNELQEVIKNKLTTVQRISLVDDYSNKENLLKKVFKKDMSNINKTIDEIDYEIFQEAVNEILNSEKVYVLGLRSSSFLAGYLGFYLNFILENVTVVTAGPSDIFEQLLKVTNKDIVIGISYPRYSTRTLEALNYVKRKGCKVIGITDSLISPAAQISDITLLASSNMVSFVDSLVAPMSLINALVIAIGMEKKDDITKYFESLEDIWKKHSVYNSNNKNKGNIKNR
ncbi:MurR/RpiR family transcriptional regulator [Anaerosalibacter bizertensis]|uniref:MurR/RpiR family transcriptional regulator n=1 Tax=Anaerosalibacter bizertensis TaxID=932217 RepID=A0A844FFZ8_9FIRM|nr:MurR/RpiR family transcriptional regulator [Anaerosalibacter bizertensis]MBV1817429.1 MurR/RpiR family transcriptional regulator [Bacteroidales bacterium MSK.15.36]HHV27715.1 MurR/RpiR family transcriptional regulator [Tissierellia bacterium]MBU5293204.1 MurR/RpiR family transcriptional regulator [Anaerosalibacter bizertensis]MCB5558509.1 MurR/RpiR family transcriptional regulator [Anaerosalibacter bizertensis]MCG4564273.1 MurR/RpiR family transcriptional regulator [Anaerosalibacter bizerte